jgi:hypothetical protein
MITLQDMTLLLSGIGKEYFGDDWQVAKDNDITVQQKHNRSPVALQRRPKAYNLSMKRQDEVVIQQHSR